MNDSSIKYIVITILTVFWFAAFVMILDCFDSQRQETRRLENELELMRREFTEELTKQRRELQINNSICDAVITGKWE